MPNHVSFYDESLKTQIEGSYTTDGKFIHAGSGQDLLAQKLLSELAHRAAKDMNGHGH